MKRSLNENKKEISLPEIIGGGYKEFWHFKGRYRVVKGSRASKKSKTTALYYIVNIMKYSDANLLVVRKTYRTLKDSCFTELKWAINRLGVNKFWKIDMSPLAMEYLPTGQKIYFRGLDDPFKVTSITVDKGMLCWLWIEEAYEISSEAGFNTLDESIRGSNGNRELFKQITITFNPWNEGHWLKRRFFDLKDEDRVEKEQDVLAITTNYLCNEWLDEADLRVFERMKLQNPRRYRVAGLGEWGISEGLIYENFIEEEFDIEEIRKKDVKSVFGLDFGYTNDPTALFCGLVDNSSKTIYVFDELYKKRLKNQDIYDEIVKLGYLKEKIIADCAEPKSIDTLRSFGLRISPCRKGPDSIRNGIDLIQGYEIKVHPRCVNFITEISNYTWDKDKFGVSVNRPIDEFNHLMDAMRYGVVASINSDVFSFT